MKILSEKFNMLKEFDPPTGQYPKGGNLERFSTLTSGIQPTDEEILGSGLVAMTNI